MGGGRKHRGSHIAHSDRRRNSSPSSSTTSSSTASSSSHSHLMTKTPAMTTAVSTAMASMSLQDSHHFLGAAPTKAGKSAPIYNNKHLYKPPQQVTVAKSLATSVDLHKVLEEIEGSFQVTWKEMLWIFFGILLLAMLSIMVGIAAGMTISIHYYESSSSSQQHRIDAAVADHYYTVHQQSFYPSGNTAGVTATHHRVTTLDPSIAKSNVLKPTVRFDLGRVVTTSESGQRNLLSVVEEIAPLTDETNLAYQQQGPYRGPNHSVGGGGGVYFISPGGQASYGTPLYGYRPPPSSTGRNPPIHLTQPTVHPILCSDGYTMGFDSWQSLKSAVQEANSLSAERFMKWNEYFVKTGSENFAAFDDDSLYYERDVVFTICPGATLRARRGPIFLNAENIVIECEDCIVEVGGTHLAFGPHARNVLVRGVAFRRAQSSSLTFYHDGAEATFEDCMWTANAGVNDKFGSVADVNSTSTVNFYRCQVEVNKTPLRYNFKQANAAAHAAFVSTGGMASDGSTSGFASPLTIRN